MDTIFATSSGTLPAAIAVLRISGPEALAVASAIAGTLPQSRQAAVRKLRCPTDGQLLDRALVLVSPRPVRRPAKISSSFTSMAGAQS